MRLIMSKEKINNVIADNPLASNHNPLVYTFDNKDATIAEGDYKSFIKSFALTQNFRTKNGLTTKFEFDVAAMIDDNSNEDELPILKFTIFADYRTSSGFKKWYKDMTGEKVVPRTIDFSRFIGQMVKITVAHDITEEGDVYERITGMYRLNEEVGDI